jgi:hypothetical protein
MAITAGPHGVLVVGTNGFDYDAGMDAKHTPEDFYGFEFWYSPNGREFSYAGGLSTPREVDSITPRVVATRDGFLLHDDARYYGADTYRNDTPMYQSEDGENWEYIGKGLPIGYRFAAGRTGDMTFMLGAAEGTGLYARYRRDNDREWHEGSIDLGKLPDAGVQPRSQQQPMLIHPWQGGYLAIGRTLSDPLGVVWTSPDGVNWTRMPVRDNGFDKVANLVAIASSRTTTVLFGISGTAPNQQIRLWRTDRPG